jgi:hypothetical protein
MLDRGRRWTLVKNVVCGRKYAYVKRGERYVKIESVFHV